MYPWNPATQKSADFLAASLTVSTIVHNEVAC